MSTGDMTAPAEGNNEANENTQRSSDPDALPENEDQQEPVDVDHAIPREAQLVAVVAALMGTALTVPFATLAIPFGLAGFVLVALGLFYTQSRRWLSIGTLLILTGAIITGAYGALAPELMLLGVGSVILAWDVGQHGMVLANQLGRRTRTRRNLLVHTALSTLVIGFVSMIAYLTFLVASGGRQAAAVALVVVGIVLAGWVLRD